MHHHRFIIVLLVLITLASFWRVPWAQFVNYDDEDYVTGNPHVLQGPTGGNIAWAFTTFHAANYHPLTWISLMLDSRLLGTGPRGYHVVNVLLQALAAVLLYAALAALTGSPWHSGLVAALWAVHPLRVESVAWVSERKDVLSGCLAFATLLAYALYARRPAWWRYLIVAVLLALGLLAKSMLVTLPCVMMLLDVWPLRRVAGLNLPAPSPRVPQCPARPAGALILEKIPLLLLAAAFSATTFFVQHSNGVVTDFNQVPVLYRLANSAVAYMLYMVKMVWFRGLIADYSYHPWLWWQIVLAVVLLSVVSIAVATRFRRDPWLAVGWLWYLGMLVPVIGWVQVGNQTLADRYTYLPTIGLLIMVVWSLPAGLWRTRAGRAAVIGLSAAAIATLGAFTWWQTGYWQNSENLFTHVLEFDPHNVAALVNLGDALDAQGQSARGLVYLRRAVATQPAFCEGQLVLGNVLVKLGRSREALPFLLRVQELQPGRADVQDTLGRAYIGLNKADEALPHLLRSVGISPENPQSHNDLGIAYEDLGQVDRAIDEYRRALDVDGDYWQAHLNMGNTLLKQKRFTEALDQSQQALNLQPDDIRTHIQVAKVLANMGQFEKALAYLKEAVRRWPHDAEGNFYLGGILIQLNRINEALPYLEEASRLDPGNRQYAAVLAHYIRLGQTREPSMPPALPGPSPP